MKENSYVIPQMMFDQDPYHQIFYDKAQFFPVRLLCDEEELAKRVQNEITINDTDKMPDEVADIIIDHIQKILREK